MKCVLDLLLETRLDALVCLSRLGPAQLHITQVNEVAEVCFSICSEVDGRLRAFGASSGPVGFDMDGTVQAGGLRLCGFINVVVDLA
jgi:hypothetical protein